MAIGYREYFVAMLAGLIDSLLIVAFVLSMWASRKRPRDTSLALLADDAGLRYRTKHRIGRTMPWKGWRIVRMWKVREGVYHLRLTNPILSMRGNPSLDAECALHERSGGCIAD